MNPNTQSRMDSQVTSSVRLVEWRVIVGMSRLCDQARLMCWGVFVQC